MLPRLIKKLYLNVRMLSESSWRIIMTKLPSNECGGMPNFFSKLDQLSCLTRDLFNSQQKFPPFHGLAILIKEEIEHNTAHNYSPEAFYIRPDAITLTWHKRFTLKLACYSVSHGRKIILQFSWQAKQSLKQSR